MSAIKVPDPLPPAITPDREVIELFIDQDLEEFGEDSLVARTWHWILHGGGRAPISHTGWSHFHGDRPPSAPKAPPANRPLHPPIARRGSG